MNIDLTGKRSEADDESSSSSKRKQHDGSSDRTQRRHSAEVRERLEGVLERLAEWREGRGDVELATAIREDAKSMVGGVVSMTRNLPGVRGPLLFLLGVAEPLLAFGRILRILGGRMADRRARARELADEPVPEPEPEPEQAEPWRT